MNISAAKTPLNMRTWMSQSTRSAEAWRGSDYNRWCLTSLWLHCWSEDICLCIVHCTSPRYLMTIYSIFIAALSRPYCSMIIQERNFWGNSRPLLNCLRWDLTKTPNYNCQSWARLDFKYSGELCVSWNIDELTKIQIEDNHHTGTTQCSIVQLIFLIILFITNIMWSSISF